MHRHVAACCAALALACGRGKPPAEAAAGDASAAEAATPVTVAPVLRRTLAVRVSGPGATEALQVAAVQAPFAGVLTDLRVQDGDRVAAGQVIGHVVSRESAAALDGARALAAAAKSPAERRDAERALALARAGQVAVPLRAPAAGVVVSHQATAGALVVGSQDVVTVAATGAIAFVARIDQAALARVRPGEPATVEIPALGVTLPGRVHALLPLANAGEFSAPVRIDFEGRERPRAPGLFGTASIVVEEVRDAQVVPAAAVLRDDVTGTTRVATVTPEGTARWVEVRAGVSEGGDVQVVSPALPPGARVVTEGLVGLPEGARVRVRP